MCKKRTAFALAAGLVSLSAGCTAEVADCAPVTGYYYPVFELIDTVQLGGLPADCTTVPVERLDLTDDLIIMNSSSMEVIDVWKGGCEAQVTYTVTVTSNNNRSSRELFNNIGTKYAVRDGGSLHGEAVYIVKDINGNDSCAAIFNATWHTEAQHRERQIMMQQRQ